MESKINLTLHSDDELSTWVFNDEELYKIRDRSYLKDTLDSLFIYTDDQYDVLMVDIQNDIDEENAS